MKAQQKTIIWDFDGTLAQRPGLWSGVMMEVLDEYCPGHSVERSVLSAHLRESYPWNIPYKSHHELSEPKAWWAYIEDIIAKAYQAGGVPGADSERFSIIVHQRQLDPKGYVLYDDTLSVLEHLQICGWNNIILSNHIPELPKIAGDIGLGNYIKVCISSANTGYEKPHPEAFKTALRACGDPEHVWMIGDNIDADIRGAQGLGIPAILVHSENPGNIKYYAETLTDVISIIEK